MKTTLAWAVLVGGGLLGVFGAGCGSGAEDAGGVRGATAGSGSAAEAGASGYGPISAAGAPEQDSAGSRAAEAGSPGQSSGSSGSSGATAASSEKDAAAACDDFAAALCAKIATCNSWFVAAEFEDLAACRKRYAVTSGCVESLALRGTSLTVSQIDACASATASSTCSEWLNEDPSVFAPCLAKPGALANGTGCGADAQCQSGHCRFSGDCGVCGPTPGPGDACSSGDYCAPGLRCIGLACVRAKGAGDACESSAQCPNSLACIGGYCSSPKSAGEACAADDCDAHAGLACVDGVCRNIHYVAPGEACDPANQIDCAAGGFCRGASSTSLGTCVAPAQDGEPCDDERGPRCLPWASCSAGFCKVTDAAACL